MTDDEKNRKLFPPTRLKLIIPLQPEAYWRPQSWNYSEEHLASEQGWVPLRRQPHPMSWK